MSLLDDARRIVESDRLQQCDGFGCLATSHSSSCPYRVLPEIVAALEAGERLAHLAAAASQWHMPQTVKMGPFKKPDDPDTITVCAAGCIGWPCDGTSAGEVADELLEMLDGEVVPQT